MGHKTKERDSNEEKREGAVRQSREKLPQLEEDRRGWENSKCSALFACMQLSKNKSNQQK